MYCQPANFNSEVHGQGNVPVPSTIKGSVEPGTINSLENFTFVVPSTTKASPTTAKVQKEMVSHPYEL
jgi:hypothetical protein